MKIRGVHVYIKVLVHLYFLSILCHNEESNMVKHTYKLCKVFALYIIEFIPAHLICLIGTIWYHVPTTLSKDVSGLLWFDVIICGGSLPIQSRNHKRRCYRAGQPCIYDKEICCKSVGALSEPSSHGVLHYIV